MANTEPEKTDATIIMAGMSEATQLEEILKKDSEYLKGWALISLALALMFSAFMLALDGTIIATATPQITKDFSSLNDMGWYGAAYQMSQMAMLPACGRLYTLYNVKYTYIAMIVVFELGSVICAAAPTSTVLIVGRAVAGLGAAGLLSGSTVIISYCVVLQNRALTLAIILGTYGIGTVIGPLIGGIITDNKVLRWRFVFWINLPIGFIGLVQIWFTLKKPPPPAKPGLSRLQQLKQLDIPGITLLIGAITSMMLALQWGGIVYAWSDPKVFGCLIGFGLLLILFLVLQSLNQENCTIPLRIFKNRTVCTACAFVMLLQMAIVAQVYYWPIYFQGVKDTSAKTSGIYMLPLVISNSITTISAGWLTSRVGYYVPFMWIGAPILAAGGGLFQLIRMQSPASRWIWYQIVSGIGYGTCTQVPILSVQVVLDKVDVPTGCVMVIFFQCLGGALATSIGQNLFTDKLQKELYKIDGLSVTDVMKAGAKQYRELVPPELLEQVVEAFVSALQNVFLLALASAAFAAAMSLGMEWRRIPEKIEAEDLTSETPSDSHSSKSPA